MRIILLERVEKLGHMGDLVNVKPGYARNYLLPMGKALRANKVNIEKFENEKVQREADNISRRKDAENIADKMEGLSVDLVRAASEMGQLFGSVTSRDIADAISDAGFTIKRNQISLNKSIKTLGLHNVQVALHPEVTVTVIINIARTLEEALIQIKTGIAVTGEKIDEQNSLTEAAVAAIDQEAMDEGSLKETDAQEPAGTELNDSSKDI